MMKRRWMPQMTVPKMKRTEVVMTHLKTQYSHGQRALFGTPPYLKCSLRGPESTFHAPYKVMIRVQ